jgi:alpha-L-fucosidase
MHMRLSAVGDIRFVSKGNVLFAIALAWPADGKISIKSLAEGSAADLGAIEGVRLLGSDATLKWARDRGGLQIELPTQKTGEYAWVFRVTHSSR